MIKPKGIEVGEKEIKVSLCGDDSTVFVRDLDSVTELLAFLNDFKNLSGLEINTTKTEGMWLGCCWNAFRFFAGRETQLELFAFSFHTIKIRQLNLIFVEKIRNLEKILNSWKKRNLTLYGKINIAKTLGLSKLIYNVLVIPEQLIKEINFNQFYLGWKTPKD